MEILACRNKLTESIGQTTKHINILQIIVKDNNYRLKALQDILDFSTQQKETAILTVMRLKLHQPNKLKLFFNITMPYLSVF